MMSAEEQTVKILIVDDDKGILQSLAHLLKDENFEVLTAESGAEGLEILKQSEGIGVIVSDQLMPGMSGIDFLCKAWDLAPDALRIMLTCYDSLNVEHEACYKAGAFRFITKPWRSEELLRALRDAVTTYMLILENRRLTSRLSPKCSEKADRHREMTYFATV